MGGLEVRYLLDTHTWIWWNSNTRKLSRNVLKLLTMPESDILLSAVSVWEFSKLIELGKLRINCDGYHWITEALDYPNLELVGLTPEIFWHAANLPGQFHKDPADQMIVATARILNATILTRDKLISEYSHVRSSW